MSIFKYEYIYIYIYIYICAIILYIKVYSGLPENI